MCIMIPIPLYKDIKYILYKYINILIHKIFIRGIHMYFPSIPVCLIDIIVLVLDILRIIRIN